MWLQTGEVHGALAPAQWSIIKVVRTSYKHSLSAWSVILVSSVQGGKSCDCREPQALSCLISEAEDQELMASTIGATLTTAFHSSFSMGICDILCVWLAAF
jgi:hypothetical protein